MAKFLDKKERVIDFKLTPTGRQKLAIGKFKPSFYRFFDDGIMYDSEYGGFTESQNSIDERIKNDTQFIEGLLSFTDIEEFSPIANYDQTIAFNPNDSEDKLIYEEVHFDPTTHGAPIKTDKFSFGPALSDVLFDSENISYAPATKIVTCQGQITKIDIKDTTDYDTVFDEDIIDTSTQDISSREYNIPQIDIALYYTKQIGPPSSALDANDIHGAIQQTSPFADNNVIKLIRNDIVVYAEEINTELLTENYEVEVFEIIEDTKIKKLEKKYFRNTHEQIVDGIMRTESEKTNISQDYTPESVEYYFDVLTDAEISGRIVCGCASTFNKDSYYIDIDHDCEELSKAEQIYFDIYGSVTVPEICGPEAARNNLYDNQTTPDLEQKDSIESCED